MKNIQYILIAFILILSVSCEKDKEFELSGPNLTALREGPPEFVQEPGLGVLLEFKLEAANGLSILEVSKDDQPYDTKSFSDEISSSYLFEYTVPADEENDTERIFSFQLTDKENKVATYSLNVIARTTFSETRETINGIEVVKIKGRLNNSYTLTSDNTYLIDSIFSIENQSSLTIEKGTTVYFKTYDSSVLSKLAIAQNSKLIAEGTAEEPIVFTSDKLLTGEEPTSEDWGGISIYGNAPTNEGNVVLSGGFRYGGSTPNDNSGVLKFVRIEYAGKDGNNALNLLGVGARTTVEHVQIFRNENIAFRLKGGRVNLKYIAAIGHGGYGVWAEYGWQGNGQFWLFQTDIEATLVPVNFWNQARSIEMRNDANMFLLTPRTQFKISNVTLIGNGYSEEEQSGTRRGVRIRRGATGVLQNMLVTEFPDEAVRVEDLDLAELNNTMILNNTRSFKNKADYVKDAEIFFEDNALNVTDNSTSGVTLTNFVGSESSPFDPATLGNFFSPAPYIGAVENASNDWTSDGNWFKNLNGTIR